MALLNPSLVITIWHHAWSFDKFFDCGFFLRCILFRIILTVIWNNNIKKDRRIFYFVKKQMLLPFCSEALRSILNSIPSCITSLPALVCFCTLYRGQPSIDQSCSAHIGRELEMPGWDFPPAGSQPMPHTSSWNKSETPEFCNRGPTVLFSDTGWCCSLGYLLPFLCHVLPIAQAVSLGDLSWDYFLNAAPAKVSSS